MLKHSIRDVPFSKRTQDRYVPCRNIDALQQLNHGSLWIKLEDGRYIILYGATLNAWKGEKTEKLFVVENGVEKELSASTPIEGFYEQRDLPKQYANIWDEWKKTFRKRTRKT